MKTITRAGYRVNEWAESVGVCQGSVWNMIRDGQLHTIKVRGARVITESPRDFLVRIAKGDDLDL